MSILRYASDLHLELLKNPSEVKQRFLGLWKFHKNPAKNYYLALVGDIGNPFFKKDNLTFFLKKVSSKYKKIFYIIGNHEYYNLNFKNNKNMEDVKQELKNIVKAYPNIRILDNEIDYIENIPVLGTTLWSQITNKNIEKSINDYRLILNNNLTLKIKDTNEINNTSVKFIKDSLEQINSHCIILSHHAPLTNSEDRKLCSVIYENGEYEQAFHNKLDELIKHPIILWIYGHTHYCSSFFYKNVFICTNQAGYVGEGILFNPLAEVDLENLMSITSVKVN